MQDEYNNHSNVTIEDMSWEYLNINSNCTVVNTPGGPCAGSQPMDTTLNSDFYKNTKTMCALSKLTNNNTFKAILNNFIGETKPIDLNFMLVPLVSPPGTILYGSALPNPLTWNASNVDIRINKNLIDSLPSIQVAFTLLHEGIHAEIFRKLLSINGPSNLTNQNFPTLFNMYRQFKGYQHEYMANYYIDRMANALSQYDGNKFHIDFYKAFAWDGLNETDYYRNTLTATQKADIDLKRNQLLKDRTKIACDD